MVNREQVLEALKHIKDPGYNLALTDLQLIKDIMIRDERVNLTVVVTTVYSEITARLEAEVTRALQAIGVKEVHARFRALTDFEKSEVDKRIGQARAQARDEAGGLDEMQAKRQAEMQAEGIPGLLAPGSTTKFIAVASGKGGVGKSTVTVNLAAALARQGKKVGVMDADIYGFSVPDMMGITEPPAMEDNLIVPVEKLGVKVISMGFFVQDNAPVIWRGPMLGKMLRNFFKEVRWDEVEYMLLDLPPGTGDIALDVHQMIPHSTEIIVTTPHATAAFVAARAGAMALHTKHELLGVVENMAYYECPKCGDKDYVFGRGGGAKLAEELHTELLAQIPLGAPDNHISEADYSPAIYKAGTPTGDLYDEMAKRVIEKLSSSN